MTDGLVEVGDRGAAASGLLKQHDTVVMSMSGTKLTSRLRCVVVVRTADAGPRTTPIGAFLQPKPRSVRDAHKIADLAEREVELSTGGSVQDPIDPTGKLLFNALAMIAEFEAGLIGVARVRT